MAILSVNRAGDFSKRVSTDITDIHFANHVNSVDHIFAGFSSAQFGPGLISNTINVTRSESKAVISVAFNAGTTEFNARGWSFADNGISASFFGTAEEETLYGSRFDDQISLGGGADTIYAGRGNDEIISLSDGGPDHIDGGRQHDKLSLYRTTSTQDFIVDIGRGGEGNDIGDGTTFVNIEELFVALGSGDDYVVGGSAGDYILGLGGNDVIDGGRQFGVKASRSDRDYLSGGSGSDRFVFAELSDSGPSPRSCDIIADFKTSLEVQSDKLDISKILTDLGVALTLSGSTGFTGVAGELIVTKTDRMGKTFLDFDADGDQDSDFRIEFTGNLNFTIDDFILA